MHNINVEPIRTVELRVRALNDANRSFLTVGAATEYENRVRERIRHQDLIVDGVVANIVHGSAQQRRLAVNSSRWDLGSICQPGKCRNLRVGHSVRHQDLLPLAVVADGARISDHQTDLIGRTSSNHAQRRNVSICRDWKNSRSVIAHVRNPEFAVLDVEAQTCWVFYARFWSFDDSCGSNVAAIRRPKDEDRIFRIICDEDLAAVFMYGNMARQVQLRLGTFDDAQGWVFPTRASGIDVD